MGKPVERSTDRRQSERRTDAESDRRALDLGPPERRDGSERRHEQKGPPERRSGKDRREDEQGVPKGVYVERRRKVDPRRPEIHESTLDEWLDCREHYVAEHAEHDSGAAENPAPADQDSGK